MKKQQHREEEIFLQALEIEVGPAREAYLDEACGGDATLREKAEKLVEAHEEPASILETFGSMGAPTGERARDQIGSYELLEELGAGGMGTVWLAQQSEPVVRKVALKIIRLGMDTKEVVSRFEAERQALAMMDHPNIAKVFDAGATETGRPYFVMELVKGIAITRYCDQEKLGTKERLDLFIKACQAIQHAHQKGIIHRDIKPSNIMVTLHDGVPVPKVIDFGIAKATEGRLTDATVYTQLHQFIGTPAYMSPEQAEMSSLDIDTRSDIYSLGVLLYELLAGSPPFDGRELMSQGLDAMRRTIREKEPVRPSLRLATLRGVELTTTAKRRAIEAPKLIHLLKGDLDWVVMKCLEKERARRYETANGLAADLKRYLNTEPVVARPPSRYYVFQKNVRRHKLAFAAVTAVTVTLCLGILVSNWQTVRAKQAERRATQSELLAKAEAVRANEQQRLAEERLTSTQQAVKEATEQRNRADRASDMAQSSLYYAEMHLGQRTWREHRGLKQMRDLLATWIPQNGSPDRRGWEWFYFNSLPYQNLRTLTVSGGNKFDQNIRDTPSTVEWNMASQRLAEGRGDGLIRIWDVDRERPTQVLKGPAPISSWCGSRWFAWSPTAQKLTAGGRDGTVVVWRTDSGRQLTVLRGHQSAVLAVAFSSDGTQVAAWGADGTIKIWEVATSQLTANITHPDGASTGAWSPNDALLATGHYDGTVTLSETHADSKVVTLGGHARTVHRLAWSPNSARLATASGDHTAKIWDVASGKMVLGPFDHSHEVTSIAWHPEGQRLATGSTDQTVKIWNTTTGFEISTLRGHLESLSSLSWGPDSRLASGSRDSSTRIWESVRDQEASLLPADPKRATAVSWSPDGRWLASGGDAGNVRIWNPTTHKEVQTLHAHEAGKASEEFGLIRSLTWSPDGMHLASAGLGGATKVWEVASGREIFALPDDYGPVWSVSWSSDGTRLAAGSQDGIRVVENLTGTPQVHYLGADGSKVPRGNRPPSQGANPHYLAWSPRGDRLAYGEGHFLKIWDPVRAAEIARIESPGIVLGVSWSPDGKRLAAVSFAVANHLLVAWNAETGEKLSTMRGHNDMIDALTWSADGLRLASAGIDNSVRIWDPRTGKETFVLRADSGMFHDISWHPDGAQLAAACNDGHIWIWDSTRGFERDMTPRALPYIERKLASGNALREDRLWFAEWYIQAGKPEQALSALGDDPYALCKLARQFEKEGNTSLAQTARLKALPLLKHLRTEEPDNVAPVSELAELLLMTGAHAADPEQEQHRLAAMQLADPWAKLAAAYHILGDQQSLDLLLNHRPALAAGLGDL